MMNYKSGQSVYINDTFSGMYVEQLSDILMTEDEMQKSVEAGACGHFTTPNVITNTPYYGRRTVYNENHGTIEQVLINYLNEFSSWINLPDSAVFKPCQIQK